MNLRFLYVYRDIFSLYIYFVFKNKNQYNYRITKLKVLFFSLLLWMFLIWTSLTRSCPTSSWPLFHYLFYHGLKPRAFISKISLESNWRVFKTLMLLHIKHLIKIAKYYSLLLSSYLLWESCDDPSVPHIELYALPRS